MAIHVALHHHSLYHYDRPVMHAPHTIRLRPAPHCRTKILSYSLKITPEQEFVNWQQDPFGNYAARLVFEERTDKLQVDVDIVAEMSVLNPFDYFVEEYAEHYPFEYPPALSQDLKPFLKRGRTPVRLKKFIEKIRPKEKLHTNDFIVRINQSLWKEIKYLVRLEAGVQTPGETLALGSGSCRDSAWLLVHIFRRLGIAARFTSGYLIQLKPDQKSLDGPSGAEQDFTDLHAWCEVYLPGAGWIGLDPTSGLLAGEGHIPLACTPEPTTAAAITGAVEKCESTFEHEMNVTRIHETPRVTLPYTDDQWKTIESLGHAIDRELKTNDVRLTMGGEPTFISIDNMDGEEWNFTALGPEKRRLAENLIFRLQDHFAPGSLLHFGQGKWYPGESLPRWALGCFWRRDGEPVWHDKSLFAREGDERNDGPAEAECFITILSQVLDVDEKHVIPAYEDAWYYLWRERKLPTNVDPLQSNLKDKEERRRLAKLFDRGLDQVAGYTLPLKRIGDHEWTSGRWFLRREHMYLIPGDSAMGLRLPLDSQPWVKESDYPHIVQPDPSIDFDALPPTETIRRQTLARALGDQPVATGQRLLNQDSPEAKRRQDRQPKSQESADWIVRTALCVEPRDGRLHVFMPPLESSEEYLELISAIEETATQLKQPVIIEGETPPHDPRLNRFSVTPDPGVIEVNMHPVSGWDEMVENTEVLYEEARQSRLGTDKFMIDGRHVGTGGGNHLVLGGATPKDSPFLRRPDLLRSMVAFWQNHPSLSYLFSGLFIGPTSQHPRFDEARNDSLHEMEIAFQQLPTDEEVPPWLVDRLFRNLLVDATGNTHRAEFSIDKLYSPDSSSGRLGLVEMRGFEMPPHARMSLAQQMLLRALVARFWKKPYNQDLVRWRTEVHDRFMLPHFNEVDFRDIIADLNDHGYPLEFDWFAPHFEFRFPNYGDLTRGGVNLEIRHALEPWNVLGEEGFAGATVRNVDSSLERLQVKAKGLVEGRHVITCNGYEVPLRPTGTETEGVAAVRFRAWQPPECLHPTIGVHAPLTFDIVDTWNHRSLGGCTYHVSHPGGRGYDTLPINAYEAESRRLSRFFHHGHSPGRMETPQAVPNPDFPFTLDLRRT